MKWATYMGGTWWVLVVGCASIRAYPRLKVPSPDWMACNSYLSRPTIYLTFEAINFILLVNL
jgi:hypothetical protein